LTAESQQKPRKMIFDSREFHGKSNRIPLLSGRRSWYNFRVKRPIAKSKQLLGVAMILGGPMGSAKMPAPKCAKCGGDTQEGFIPDSAHSGNEVPFWIAGKPEIGMLEELKQSVNSRIPS
jgi:hypothetical protein